MNKPFPKKFYVGLQVVFFAIAVFILSIAAVYDVSTIRLGVAVSALYAYIVLVALRLFVANQKGLIDE